MWACKFTYGTYGLAKLVALMQAIKCQLRLQGKHVPFGVLLWYEQQLTPYSLIICQLSTFPECLQRVKGSVLFFKISSLLCFRCSTSPASLILPLLSLSLSCSWKLRWLVLGLWLGSGDTCDSLVMQQQVNTQLCQTDRRNSWTLQCREMNQGSLQPHNPSGPEHLFLSLTPPPSLHSTFIPGPTSCFQLPFSLRWVRQLPIW